MSWPVDMVAAPRARGDAGAGMPECDGVEATAASPGSNESAATMGMQHGMAKARVLRRRAIALGDLRGPSLGAAAGHKAPRVLIPALRYEGGVVGASPEYRTGNKWRIIAAGPRLPGAICRV